MTWNKNKILYKRIMPFIRFFLLCIILFISCHNHPSSRDAKVTSALTKDSIINIIQNIADYIALHDSCSLGVDSIVKSLEKKYDISFSNQKDSSTEIWIKTNIDFLDSTENGVDISLLMSDSTNRISLDDLSQHFEKSKDFVFDKRVPLPMNIPGHYNLYIIKTKYNIPVFMLVRLNSEMKIEKLHIKKQNKFSWLIDT